MFPHLKEKVVLVLPFLLAASLTGCQSAVKPKQETRSSIDIEERLDLFGATQTSFPTTSEDSAESIYLLGETFYRLGERERAVEQYEILIEEYPQNPYAFKARERLKFYEQKDLEAFSYETLFTALFGEDYMEEPAGEQIQYLNQTSEFVTKQAFQFTALTPRKYLGVVGFFNESGLDLELLPKDFTRYLVNGFRLTDRFQVVPSPQITDFFREVMESKGLKPRLRDHDLMFEKVMARQALSMGFNLLCLGSITKAELVETKNKGMYQTEIKLNVRVLTLDPLSSEIISDYQGIFRTVLKTDRKIAQSDYKFASRIDETEIMDFSNNIVHNILSKIHMVEWFGRVLEAQEVIEEEKKEKIPDEKRTAEWFNRFFQQEEKKERRIERVEKQEVVINTGSTGGISIGDELLVYKLGFTSFDPASGRYEFDRKRLRGELKITGFLDEHRSRAAIVKGANNIKPDDLVVMKYWHH